MTETDLSAWRDPETPAEWQEAVNWAEACLLVESARLYGLIVGGPRIYVARCEQILAEGLRRQVVPTRDGVDACIAGLIATLPRGTSQTSDRSQT